MKDKNSELELIPWMPTVWVPTNDPDDQWVKVSELCDLIGWTESPEKLVEAFPWDLIDFGGLVPRGGFITRFNSDGSYSSSPSYRVNSSMPSSDFMPLKWAERVAVLYRGSFDFVEFKDVDDGERLFRCWLNEGRYTKWYNSRDLAEAVEMVRSTLSS